MFVILEFKLFIFIKIWIILDRNDNLIVKLGYNNYILKLIMVI